LRGADRDADGARRGARPRRRARGWRRRLPAEAVLAARAGRADEGDLPAHRAAGACGPARARRRRRRPRLARRDRRRPPGRADGEGVRPARVLHRERGRRRLARPAARPRLGAGVPGRHAHGRRARRPASPQARPAEHDQDAARRGLQGRSHMSLRWRLFVAMLAALAMTVALVIAIGAVLTRQQVDRTQASGLAHSADQLAAQRRANVTYSTEKHTTAGGVLLWVARRPAFDGLVPDVDRSSDGQTDYGGKRQLYSYRTIPHLGLMLLRPASARAAAWRPFLTDLLLAALAGVALAAVLSFAIARSITRPIRRVAEATRRIAAEKRHEPLPREGAAELAALAASRDAERAFLLSVSHELKTPLTAIRGWAEGLAEGAFEPEDAARTITV